jgi:hypothetical protein
MLEKETLDDRDLDRIFGHLETWVDPDTSALDEELADAPIEPIPAEPDQTPVVASERSDGDVGVDVEAAPASRTRPRLRWRLRPGTSGT